MTHKLVIPLCLFVVTDLAPPAWGEGELLESPGVALLSVSAP